MTNAKRFAENCIPDLAVALAPGETPEQVADSLMGQFWAETDGDRAECRDALIARLQSA